MVDKPDDKSSDWREKYFNLLDKQEQQEKKSSTQQELLRRALVRVSVSADGQDDALDVILGQLRERVRNAGDIKNVLTQLDEAVVNFEQHRNSNAQKIRQSLMDMVKPLQQLELSRLVKKEISQYLAQLPQSSKKVRLYPTLLQQLASIQQQALKEIEQPKLSLWQKLMGKYPAEKTPEKATDVSGRILMVDKVNEAEKSVEAWHPISVAENERETRNYAAIDAELTAANSAAQLNERQKNYQIATELPPEFVNKVTQILNQFLIRLETETAITQKAQSIRADIKDAVNADNLLTMLENIRDLVMQAYLLTNHDFAVYLKNVHQELANIYSVVGGAVKSESLLHVASHKMQNSMMQGIKALASSTESATDLEQLKKQLNSQIGNIRDALDNYQQAEQEQQLATQLEALGKKIKSMEVDAEKNRSILAKQRHKALHDPLTELPNREYYNDRSVYEFHRWQRYGRALTIAIFDIDHFKNINDNYGHQAGDRVLKVIGSSIAKSLREVDFFCRFGGEEFVALMPETAREEAMLALDKIRAAIANASFNYKDQSISITVSIGATEFKGGDDVESAFARADKALYAAKAEGRNCSRSA